MSGTRIALGRTIALGVLLALSLLLLGASKAEAGKYAVAQCGWYVGADAAWADTTGGLKFRPDAYCVPPAGADPFADAHMKSFTRAGQGTVSGTRFARWRWTTPAGTGITQVRGTWWHALHDGIEHRLGTDPGNGAFNAFASAAATDTAPREFAVGFWPPQWAFEDRLLCARADTKSCSLDAVSWSALRALTITVEDDSPPAAGLAGRLTEPGWHLGSEGIVFWGGELGGGIRFAETSVDGARVNLTEYPCAKALIGGEWRATLMRPCPLGPSGAATVDTTRFSDGRHGIRHCVTDFAGNAGCTPEMTIAIDNNPPAHPRAAALAGGDGWRRTNDFDLSWTNPDQGPASPIWGAYWRVTGPGHDTGVRLIPGLGPTALANLTVPAPGLYTLRLWLRDEAGNESAASAVEVPLRFDDVSPDLAFEAGGGEVPAQLRAELADPLSGPARGTISYRRLDQQAWTELPTRLEAGGDPGRATLVAPTPELAPGTYVFRAEGADAAGNAVATTLRADGTQMTIQRVPPPHVPRSKARLFAWLRGGRGRGEAVTVPFGATALLGGRLTRADGAAAGDRELRVVSRPSRGSLVPTEVQTVRTGEQGGFELRLAPGPSRRVTVAFAGDGGLGPARRPALELRVRSGISLRAAPRKLRTGEALRLSGKVAGSGAPLPRRGKLVAIQYLEEATRRWRPVLVTRTDHNGRYRARYRFRYVTGQATIRLRATALAEERWPYAPGSSPQVTVRVRG
jgi:hypothetical protein